MSGRNFDFFIRDYDSIRQMLLQLFVYGCYDRENGAAHQDISSSYYSATLKRINYFWPNKLTTSSSVTNKRIHRFPFDKYANSENYLARSYEIKSFSPQDLNCFIFILQSLSSGCVKTITEIISDIETCVYGECDTDINFSMIQSNIESMADAGFLGKTAEYPASYRIAEDPFADLLTDDLCRLYDLIMIYRDVLPLSNLGYRCQHFVEDYITYVLGDDLPVSPSIGLTDVFCQTILNDEIVYALTIAMEQHKKITFQLPQKHESFVNATPLRIIYDRDYGRQYIFGLTENELFFIRRLDYITDLSVSDSPAAEVSLSSLENILIHIWSSSMKFSSGKDPLFPVKIEFNWKAGSESLATRLKKSLLNEKRMGSINTDNEDIWIYELEISDPNEMIPWLRSYGKFIKISLCTQDDFYERISNSLESMHSTYINKAPFKSDEDTYTSLGRGSLNGLSTVDTALYHPKLFSEYRNSYFRAVLQLYYQTLINGEPLSESKIKKYINQHVFSGDTDRCLTDRIAEAFCHQGTNIKELSLWKFSDDNVLMPAYITEDDVPPLPPLLMMNTEKRWLATLLQEPLAVEILGPDLQQRLKTALSAEPFCWKKLLVERGCHNSDISPNNPHLSQMAALALRTIRGKRGMIYKKTDGEEAFGIPTHFAYSPYRRDYMLLMSDKEQNIYRLNLKSIKSFKPVVVPRNVKIFVNHNPEPIRLAISPMYQFNNIERCFLSFSVNRKQGYYDPADKIYYLDIFYYDFELEDIIRKILSLGETAYVESPQKVVQKLKEYL